MNPRWIILVSILLIGTQPIKLPVGGLSLFQISIIFVGLIGIVSLLGKKKFPPGRYILFSLLYLVSGFVSYVISINPDCKGNLLVSIMTSMIVLFVPLYFERTDSRILVKTLIRSQYIAVPFGIFMWFTFYQLGFFPETINLPGGFYVEFDSDAQTRSMFGQELRLTLPYATPPVLSVAMAMSLVMLYYVKDLFKKNIRVIIMIAFTLILIFTGSRTGVFGLVMFLGLRLLGSRKKININWGLVFIVIVAIFLLFIFSSEIPYVDKFLERFTTQDEDLSEDRHLLVPIDGILIWLSSFKYFFIGIGFGSSLYMDGFLTFLPPHFLNSFVTLIAERGIIGFVLVIQLISMAIVLYKREKKMSAEERALTFALIVGLFSTIFYETFDCYFMIFLLAIGFMLEVRTKRNIVITT